MTTTLPPKTLITDNGTRYTLARALGRGGFGTTCLVVPEGAAQRSPSRPLAGDGTTPASVLLQSTQQNLRPSQRKFFVTEMVECEGDEQDDEAAFQYAVKSLRKMLGSCVKLLEEREKAQSHPLYALWVRARAMPGVDPVEVVRRYIQGTQETAAR